MKKFFLVIFLCFCFTGFKFQVLADEELTVENFLTQADEEIYPSVSGTEYKPAFFKMLLILIALISLIFLTFWIFKRMMRMRVTQANMTKNIKVLEKRVISPKSMLYLVEIEGKRVLISESNLEVRKIKDLD